MFILNYSQPLFQFNDVRFLKQNMATSQKLDASQNAMQVRQFKTKIANLLLDFLLAQEQVLLAGSRLSYLDTALQKTEYLVQAGKIIQEDYDLLLLEKHRATAALAARLA